MLENDDAKTIRQWLAQSLADATDGRRAALARYCGVTPQAVNGWLRTGRMRKANMARAAEFLGTAPAFSAGPVQVSEPAPQYSISSATDWPFVRIDKARIAALRPDELARLEGAWLVAAAHLGVVVTAN